MEVKMNDMDLKQEEMKDEVIKTEEKDNNSKKEESKVEENKTEEKIEDKTEEKTENKTEEKTEDKTQEKIEDKTEEKKEIPSIYLPPYVDPSIEKRKAKKKITKKVFFIVASVLILIYFGGVYYFSKHFSSNTKINGKDISFLTVAEAEKIFDEVYHDFCFEVQFVNDKRTFSYGDGSLSITLEQTLSQLNENQNPFLWPYYLCINNAKEVPYSINFDESEMKKYISSFDAMDKKKMIESTDAYVKYSDGTAIVIADRTGTVLDEEKVYETITTGLKNMDSMIDIHANDCYVKADVLADSEEIQDILNQANQFLELENKIMIGDYSVVITPEEVTQMVYIDKNGKLAASKNNISVYASKFVEKYNTVDTDRVFKTHDNKKISIHGTKYGWIFDKEQIATDLTAAFEQSVKDMTSFSIETVPIQSGYGYDDQNDIGDSYVEIDLSNQHFYLYVDGKIVHNADVVTGNVRLGHTTPGGLFGLTYKSRNTVLVGPGYASPVSYWMPFNGGIGMHDASWRGKFGGEIYKTDGSHGCINMYITDAATVYEYVEVGFPVVCYWRDEE